jgi:hypothetical protein
MSEFLSSINMTSGTTVQNKGFLCTILKQTEGYSIAETHPAGMERIRVEILVPPTVVVTEV